MDNHITLTGLIEHLATDQASHEASTRQAPHELTQTEKTKITELPLKNNVMLRRRLETFYLPTRQIK